MDYNYDRPVSRARGRLVASRQAFFEQASNPSQKKDSSRPLTSLVDEKLEMFTKSAQEATRNLAKSTPDLTALEEDANIRVSQHLSKSRSNLNQTFDSSLFRAPKAVDEADFRRPSSPNKSFSSYFTAKKPPLPPKKPSSPPPPAPVAKDTKTPALRGITPPAGVSKAAATTVGSVPGAGVAPSGKMSEFDRIVNSIKSTDTYKRYKNHPAMSQPDLRRRSKSLGFLELDEEDNWVLPTKPVVEPVFPELSERSVSTTHLAKKTASKGGSTGGAANTSSDDEASDYEDVPIPCNRLTAAKSEFELRVEKSLKNLNVPDWYTKSSRPSSRASILSGRNTPAMSSERFTRNRPDYESFRSAYSVSSSTATPKRETVSRTTTPSWRSFSRRSPPTPSSESEHQSMEKTQNWINSQHSVLTTTTTTASTREPYAGWRRAKDLSDTEFSSSFEEKRCEGSERYSFLQAVNNSVLSEDRSYLETSFDSTPTTEYHNKVWIESSLISRPAVNGYRQTDYQEIYKGQNYPGYRPDYGVYEKRQNRHPDVIYNKEKPPRPSTRNPFSGGLLEAVV
ncbi:uncharacterized protein LOC100903693 [Galendromus occidentalis]|uniref:Uncharacterized protein LOC100903693 n=1 Tax=Galendromus occidentalis TaxID=34638 RepID=A0AAJ7WH10_9ACAR|nr:uncharacterized protein LOC100903693 [Galendromus occidentalis]